MPAITKVLRLTMKPSLIAVIRWVGGWAVFEEALYTTKGLSVVFAVRKEQQERKTAALDRICKRTRPFGDRALMMVA
jgi:hypothetical protein